MNFVFFRVLIAFLYLFVISILFNMYCRSGTLSAKITASSAYLILFICIVHIYFYSLLHILFGAVSKILSEYKLNRVLAIKYSLAVHTSLISMYFDIFSCVSWLILVWADWFQYNNCLIMLLISLLYIYQVLYPLIALTKCRVLRYHKCLFIINMKQTKTGCLSVFVCLDIF